MAELFGYLRSALDRLYEHHGTAIVAESLRHEKAMEVFDANGNG